MGKNLGKYKDTYGYISWFILICSCLKFLVCQNIKPRHQNLCKRERLFICVENGEAVKQNWGLVSCELFFFCFVWTWRDSFPWTKLWNKSSCCATTEEDNINVYKQKASWRNKQQHKNIPQKWLLLLLPANFRCYHFLFFFFLLFLHLALSCHYPMCQIPVTGNPQIKLSGQLSICKSLRESMHI